MTLRDLAMFLSYVLGQDIYAFISEGSGSLLSRGPFYRGAEVDHRRSFVGVPASMLMTLWRM